MDDEASALGDAAAAVPPRKKLEVVAFHANTYGGSPDDPVEQYDWSKVTTFVPDWTRCDTPGAHSPTCHYNRTAAFARSHGARVCAAPFGTGRTAGGELVITHGGPTLPNVLPFSQLRNESARREWLLAASHDVVSMGFGAAMFDVEDLETAPSAASLGPGLSNLTCEMQQELRRSGVSLSTCLAIMPEAIPGVYLQAYEVARLSRCVDFVFVMAYDMTGPSPDPDRPHCSNSPLDGVTTGLHWYLSHGVDPSSVVLGLPWYGYDYVCNGTVATCCSQDLNPANHTGLGHAQIGFGPAMDLLRHNATAAGRQWNNHSMSPFFEYHSEADGQRHQVWFSDIDSLKLRYKLVRELGLKGVGFWPADIGSVVGPGGTGAGLWNKTQVKEMWAAVPATNSDGAGAYP